MSRRIGLVAFVAIVIGGLYLAGFFDLIDEPDRVRATLASLGVWAPILYVAAFALLEPFFVPGIAFIIPGAMYFSFGELFFLSWLGSIGAGIVGFSFARFIGREYVERKLPERFRRYDERLASHALQTVILIRATLFLAPPAHWLLGMSQVRFAPFVLGTAIGFLPGIAILTYLTVFVGESLGDWLSDRPPGLFAALILAIVIALRLRRRIAGRRAARQAEQSGVIKKMSDAGEVAEQSVSVP